MNVTVSFNQLLRDGSMPVLNHEVERLHLTRVYESIYVLVHLSSLVRIEPELHHNDSPTYTTLPCQPRVWQRQANTRIACLASVRHTGTYA
jgi:hypothetical protein